MDCKAPEKEGRFTAFFRLQTGRIKFGHKLSCDILCVKPAIAVVESEILTGVTNPEPCAMVA